MTVSKAKICAQAVSPATPLSYTLFIYDPEGTTLKTDDVSSYIEDFAENLSPSGGEQVVGNPVFSWTGIGGNYTYRVELYDDLYNNIWEVYNLLTMSVIYDGVPLSDGATYYYSIMETPVTLISTMTE